MSSSSICRLCGGCKLEQDLISDIYSVEANDLKLVDYISFYCRVKLSRDPSLPTKVCRVCRMHLETFIAFCDNLNKVENGLIDTSKVSIFQEVKMPSHSLFCNVQITTKKEVIDVEKTEITLPYEAKMEADSSLSRNFRASEIS